MTGEIVHADTCLCKECVAHSRDIIHADECMCPKCKEEMEIAVASTHINCNCPRCLEYNEKYPSWESRKDLAVYRSKPRTRTELINKTLNVLLDIRDMLKTMDARISDIRDARVDKFVPFRIDWPEPEPMKPTWAPDTPTSPTWCDADTGTKTISVTLADVEDVLRRGKRMLED